MTNFSSILEPSAANLAKQSWKSSRSNMATPRYGIAATVAGSQLLVCGGRNPSGHFPTVEAYDTEKDTWTTLSSMPTARWGCAAVTIDAKLFVIGGYNGSYLSCVEMMDLNTQTWTTLPSMKHQRYGCSAGVIGQFVIVVGGYDRNKDLNTAELFDPTTQQWMDMPDMSHSHYHGALVVIGTRAYVIGDGNKHVEMFHLETRQWTALPSMKTNFSEGITAVAVGRLIVVCGGGTDVVEAFDTESQTWSFLQKLPSKRCFCVAGLVGNRVLVVGGEGDGGELNSVVSLQVGGVLPPRNEDASVSVPRLPDVPYVLGRQKRKAALEKWVKEATKMKKDCLAEIETAIACANAQYAKAKGEEDEQYQEKLGELEHSHQKKVEKIENGYKQKLDNLAKVSDLLAKEVDEKLEDAEEQIKDLKKRLEGKKPCATNSLLCCPITGDIMEDPVFAADGHTYERSAIEAVFAQTPSGKVRSPATNTPLAHRILLPNVAVKAVVAQHRDESA
eukprot:CAMPEP_0116841706 /NCGR_PEP_ID=MMETSP0418-20121206/11093_1 /TAXON_ID=1158023 /ORGANISM="Astrosyne radiata, Strain 13vi08-1A" /LENGTH=502 /DNA_ID=CAMNT_0004472201 /DNA_START=77 /DNA_END=1585 /DNA_ORIENTATION=+